MELSQIKEKYVFTTRIDLDDKGEDFIELREPTMMELKDFGEDEKKNFETLKKIFPTCMIDHSFTMNGEPAKNQDVANELIKSGSKYTEIIEIWMDSIPFKKKSVKKSET